MLTAASITEYWGLDHVGIGVIFYIAFPVFCIVINSINVKVSSAFCPSPFSVRALSDPVPKYFGWVETVGGLLKVLLIITLSVAFYAVAGKCEYLSA